MEYNIIGKTFGRLSVISVSRKIKYRTYFSCLCECGNSKNIRVDHLLDGTTKSCGCLFDEIKVIAAVTHGMCRSSEYRSRNAMLDRCHNKNSKDYANYGAKGIIVCERWRESFENFLEDMGYKPSPIHSIDRHPNKNGNYEPGNCRWATMKEQNGNRNNNKWFEHGGLKMIMEDWATYFNVAQSTLSAHLKKKKFEHVYAFYKQKGNIKNV